MKLTDKLTNAFNVEKIGEHLLGDQLYDAVFGEKEQGSSNTASTLNNVINKNIDLKYYSYPENYNDFSNSYIVFYINKNKKREFKVTDNKSNSTNLYASNTVNNSNFIPTKSDTKLESNYLSDTGGYTRIDQAISLYIPDGIEYTTEHNWSAEDTRTAVMAKRFLELGIDIISDPLSLISKGSQYWDEIGPSAQRKIKESLLGSSGKAFYAGKTKDIVNPRTEFLYNSTSPRTFNYTFKFAPKNIKELETVYNIIKLFKYHSYASLGVTEKGMASGFVNFPSTFDIKYYTGGQENKHFINSTSCALTNITENLTGADGVYSVFSKELMKDSGMENQEVPAAIMLTLTFQELEMITKERFIELNK
jgi:hypothetical protein